MKEASTQAIVLTQKEKGILMHMLGIENPKRLPKKFSRNSFFAGEGHQDLPTLQSLIEKKLVDSGFANPKIFGANNKYYWVTEIGTQMIRKEKILR
jgi:hypothetical protein